MIAQGPRALPAPQNLEEAVELVIQYNKADGYNPTRFIALVRGRSGSALQRICDQLITNPETLAHIDKAFTPHPQLLTIEDFVAEYGALWGFTPSTIESAQARTKYFNQLAGSTRYA